MQPVCLRRGTTYIGKTYPATGNPELFFSWNDVPGEYETMGGTLRPHRSSSATWRMRRRPSKARPREGCRRRGFRGIGHTASAPTYTTTERVEHNDDGSSTRTATTQRNVTVTNRLEATFIKYRK